MGSDIHAVFQAKKDGVWKDIPSLWEQDRHYFLFAWLGNVRNGFGFAGVPTHSPIVPLSDSRGFPTDFYITDGEDHPIESMDAIDPRRRKYREEENEVPETIWMGDHSHSWLTADEILSATSPCSDTWDTGIVEREFLNKWDGVSRPENSCGGISGNEIFVAENPALIDEKTTHVRISWKKPADTLDYFINEVRRLKELHGEVRLVFGFDS